MPASATAAVTEPVKKDSVPEIIAASMVGTAIEFYDNYCYSSFTFVQTLIKCIISSFYMCFVIDYPHNPIRS